jgi:hypothetical protein
MIGKILLSLSWDQKINTHPRLASKRQQATYNGVSKTGWVNFILFHNLLACAIIKQKTEWANKILLFRFKQT